MGRQRHAVQLLQYHVPPDSLRLARTLLSYEECKDPPQAENTRKALVQAAIDMMMRLKAYNEVVLELLKRGRLMAAMRIVLRHRHRFVRGVAATPHEQATGQLDAQHGAGASELDSSYEPMIPKEAFFRVAVNQLREAAKKADYEEELRHAKTSQTSGGRDAQSVGAGKKYSVGCGGSASGGCRLEKLHAVYAFYRELWPFLLQPILKYAGGSRSNSNNVPDSNSLGAKEIGSESVETDASTLISTLAASISFPDDLFHDHRVSALYRSLFGFAPVSN